MVVVGAVKADTAFFTILTYSWQNPYNFTRNGAKDSNRVFLESVEHSKYPMGLLEVPIVSLVAVWAVKVDNAFSHL